MRILLSTKEVNGAPPPADAAAVAAMHARVHLCNSFRQARALLTPSTAAGSDTLAPPSQVIDNGLRLLMITPLERM